MCLLHYSYPGRNAMLAIVEDIWWPQIHRKVIDQARLREQCLQSGKNVKCIQSQNEDGKNTRRNNKKKKQHQFYWDNFKMRDSERNLY